MKALGPRADEAVAGYVTLLMRDGLYGTFLLFSGVGDT